MTIAQALSDRHHDGDLYKTDTFMPVVRDQAVYIKEWLDENQQEWFFAVFSDGSSFVMNPCDWSVFSTAATAYAYLQDTRDYHIAVDQEYGLPINLTLTHICDIIGKAL